MHCDSAVHVCDQLMCVDMHKCLQQAQARHMPCSARGPAAATAVAVFRMLHSKYACTRSAACIVLLQCGSPALLCTAETVKAYRVTCLDGSSACCALAWIKCRHSCAPLKHKIALILFSRLYQSFIAVLRMLHSKGSFMHCRICSTLANPNSAGTGDDKILARDLQC